MVLLNTIPTVSETLHILLYGFRRFKTSTRFIMSQNHLTHLLVLYLSQTIFYKISLGDILKKTEIVQQRENGYLAKCKLCNKI